MFGIDLLLNVYYSTFWMNNKLSNRSMLSPYGDAVKTSFKEFNKTNRLLTEQEKVGLTKELEQTVTIYANKYLKSESGFKPSDIKATSLYKRCLEVVGKDNYDNARELMEFLLAKLEAVLSTDSCKKLFPKQGESAYSLRKMVSLGETVSQLPNEIIGRICNNLTLKDRLNLRLVTKGWDEAFKPFSHNVFLIVGILKDAYIDRADQRDFGSDLNYASPLIFDQKKELLIAPYLSPEMNNFLLSKLNEIPFHKKLVYSKIEEEILNNIDYNEACCHTRMEKECIEEHKLRSRQKYKENSKKIRSLGFEKMDLQTACDKLKIDNDKLKVANDKLQTVNDVLCNELHRVNVLCILFFLICCFLVFINRKQG
ncbi:MAG: hypothetical protein CO175_00305 [Verrucomicrobia bacterium CG_4_9_14_3_um_filter_43_20]|nr:MAG: hypothetical protein COX01_03915 [Verrucomicrobia bacterium CG22_combo_CG10-13_8_21_14_all_43_17]PIY61590.1 MAG: hypothetical protein COY94_04445 [Verrucomicrobia bacterium CG_4_10_14_0_8_um_filter_43_34]PJA44942.1 MAG: hypothetical protein CO175_00305 [Verrucomicrobia bacterium CG_4_9_14_3_um_filter_43_20]